MSVVVLGSANADLTVGAPRWPRPGETLTGRSFATGVGGKGLNQAIAVARLGAPTAFVGRVGADAYGQQLRSALQREGVRTDGLSDDETQPTGVAVVLVDPTGQNRIVVIPGANGAVGAAEIERLQVTLQPDDVLLLQLEIPLQAVRAALRAAGRCGARVLLDPAPAPSGTVPAEFYSRHVVLTPNEPEAEALVGFRLVDDAAARRAAEVLLDRGAGAVLLKLGPRGLLWATAEHVVVAPSPEVPVTDTVGAGDAVNGAMAAALANGDPPEHAVHRAAVAGALAVTRTGAAAAMPTTAELSRAMGEAAAGTQPVPAPARTTGAGWSAVGSPG